MSDTDLSPSVVQAVMKETKDLIRSLEGTATTQVRVKAGAFAIEVEREHGMAPAAVSVGGAPAEAGPAGGLQPIFSPLVGTFYRSGSPGTPPFVKVGDVVDAGQQVGIIEAMKVMNEVASTCHGVVKEILVEDGGAVQYEQRLMLIDTQAGS